MRPDLRCAAIAIALLMLAGCAAGGGASGSLPRARKVDAEAQAAAALQVRLGQGYLTEGELQTARDKLKRALELDPNSVDAHTLMAVLSERINRPKVAEDFYRRAAELKPDDGAVNNNYGAFLCNSGRFEQAKPYFERAIEDPFYATPGVVLTNAGVCAVKAGEIEQAEAYLRQALEFRDGNAIALFELARVHVVKQDYLRARAFLQRYEAGTKTLPPEALELGAVIEERIGDAEAAARYRHRLRSEFPQYTPATTSDGTSSP